MSLFYMKVRERYLCSSGEAISVVIYENVKKLAESGGSSGRFSTGAGIKGIMALV